jgi:hypothetical protein
MKKYKLIKKYPGSREVGTIVEKCSFTGSGVIGNNKLYTNKKGFGVESPENYPEYWEEVIEKDYEILTSRVIPYTILSVKRLSDGEVFTVGDKITGYHEDARSIQTIRTCPYAGRVRLEQSGGYTDLSYATKVKQPIFLTHDGKDIFPEDTVWYVNKENLYYDYIKAYPEVKFNSEIRAYFLTREAAENYVERNKPRLSIEDCFKILQKSFLYGNGFEKEIEKYVRKNNK